MLVGQDHFVKIRRDGDPVVTEIREPRALALHRVGQQRQDFSQSDGYRVAVLRKIGGRIECLFSIRPVVNTQAARRQTMSRGRTISSIWTL